MWIRQIAGWMIVLCSSVGVAQAQGIVIGPDGRPTGLTLAAHRVQAQIEEQVAVVTVEHVFHNPGPGTVEGTLLFPLPPGAQVTRFSMEADGKEMTGELLDADEARRIYEDIVRRSLDPALLEMADYRTFRARVFPIPGGATRTITLRYDAALAREGRTVTFRYPLQGRLSTRPTGGPWPVPVPERPPQQEGAKAPGTSTIQLDLTTGTALKNLYSPSHEVDIERKGDRRATVTLEHQPGLDGRDFIFYYSLDPDEIGATLLTHRPYRDRPGYFVLLVSPQMGLGENRIQPKDVVFVLDTSGSMAGDKIDQAKAALRYSVNRLGPRDRFGLIAFSSDVDVFRDALSPPSARDEAVFFVDQLEARGGTNINAALLAALDLLADSEQGMIVFLTDGLPSTGVRDEGEIRKNIAAANRDGVRLFSFGVGYDVNTRLLDGLSQASGAFADYISPEENIEARVSTFYEKVRYPVLTDLTLDVEGADVYALAPHALPDLYKGGQLIVAGRYRRPGTATLTLRGQAEGRNEQLRYRLDFPEVERERDFVARLWGTRRVGQLLDEIRLEGENEALKEEVTALAKEFGLVTPYTSYLVREEEALAQQTLPSAGARSVHPESVDLWNAAPPPARAEAMDATTGATAVQMSKSIRALQEAETAPAPAQAGLATAQGRTLRQQADGAWVDLEYKPDEDEAVAIAFASEAYFTFLRLYPEAMAFARLGDRVVFHFRDRYVAFGKEGDALTEAQLRARFG